MQSIYHPYLYGVTDSRDTIIIATQDAFRQNLQVFETENFTVKKHYLH